MTSTRTPPGEFLKSTLLNGALLTLPLGLAAMVAIKILQMLSPLATALAKYLPVRLHYPDLIAVLLLLLLFLVTGLLAETRAGQSLGTFLENTILNHIPGYSIVRSVARRIEDVEESEKFAPALVEVEDALVPAFVVEDHPDGRYTIFVPSAPTPGVGAIYIIARERVHLVDASFLKTVKCVTHWGAGSRELLQTMRPAPGIVKEK